MEMSELLDKLIKLPKLTKKDTFTFSCSQCGECCHNRIEEYSIVLNPLDVYKISKYLGMEIKDFLPKYCNGYCGETSKLPIVIVKPKLYRGVCPFLNGEGKCKIHPVKPAVCALFPLGRMTNHETKEFTYFMNKTDCKGKETTQTIEEWLSDFNILEEEKFTIMWQEMCGNFAIILMELSEKYPNVKILQDFMLLGAPLYLAYDLSKDFMPQFEENSDKISELLSEAMRLFIGGDDK